jgi:hypothetical protein
MKRPDTPFRHHWLYYIALKIGVIAAAVVLGLLYYAYWMPHGAQDAA